MGFPQNSDLYGMIRQIIYEETLFLRHYFGKIVDNNDSMKKGRVQVTISELGFETPDVGIWCSPRQGNGMSIPKVGTWVEVYFMNGQSDQAVYLFPAVEFKEMTPKKFDGKTSTHVLFQDPEKSSSYIKYSRSQGKLDFFDKLIIKTDAGKIDMLNAYEPFVLGMTLDIWITGTLIPWLSGHTHPYVNGITPAQTSPPTPPPVSAPVNYLSMDIKGS